MTRARKSKCFLSPVTKRKSPQNSFVVEAIVGRCRSIFDLDVNAVKEQWEGNSGRYPEGTRNPCATYGRRWKSCCRHLQSTLAPGRRSRAGYVAGRNQARTNNTTSWRHRPRPFVPCCGHMVRLQGNSSTLPSGNTVEDLVDAVHNDMWRASRRSMTRMTKAR